MKRITRCLNLQPDSAAFEHNLVEMVQNYLLPNGGGDDRITGIRSQAEAHQLDDGRENSKV